MAVFNKIGIIYLVTHVCMTNSIMTVRILSNTPQSTDPTRPWLSYLPSEDSPFIKYTQYTTDAEHTIGDALKKSVSSDRHAIEREVQAGHSKVLQAAQSSNNHKQKKSQLNYQRYSTNTDVHDETSLLEKLTSVSPSTTTMKTTTRTTLPEPKGISAYQHQLPRRSSYQVIEEFGGYLTDDFYNDKLPYRGKTEPMSPYYDQRDLTTAIKLLDRFLSRTLNADSYNSELHPPPNPILGLILSRYGAYVPGIRKPRVYANMAVNNIHNNKPFGRYKLELDEEPIYAIR